MCIICLYLYIVNILYIALYSEFFTYIKNICFHLKVFISVLLIVCSMSTYDDIMLNLTIFPFFLSGYL